MTDAAFPIDLTTFQPVSLSSQQSTLTPEQRTVLQNNIQLCRDAIVFFTAFAGAKGWGGHTGGAYDTVPEVLILDSLFRTEPEKFVPIFFDEAGHRVATQYLLSVLHGHLPAEALLHYREPFSQLPGHPERDKTPGLQFSSGRLGHLWSYVNGVAMANPEKSVFCLGSDGSQQEGNDAEAARLAVAQQLNVKLLVDYNDSTCSGYPSQYLSFDVPKTLAGHGLTVLEGPGEDIDNLHARILEALSIPGPVALVNQRPMAPGIVGVEGTPKGHDALETDLAIAYLQKRGHSQAIDMLRNAKANKKGYTFVGSGSKTRHIFDATVVSLLSNMTPEERRKRVMCIDSDLGESCGLNQISQHYPEIFYRGGIMERGNFSAAAGFGMVSGKQGIFSTYSAFLEMIISEITMARLNHANVLCNFSHTGVDDLVDNTCHFGLNIFLADNGLAEEGKTYLYYPADGGQMKACVETIFPQTGLRFLFSSRSKVPDILDEQGHQMYGENYRFVIGKDDVIRQGQDGYIVAFGEMLYRALHVIETLKKEGIQVGLINKSTLNIVDEEMMTMIGQSPFVLVVEALNHKTGLGSRFGSWLLARGFSPRYAYLGSQKLGCGGEAEQIIHQGLDEANILQAVRALL